MRVAPGLRWNVSTARVGLHYLGQGDLFMFPAVDLNDALLVVTLPSHILSYPVIDISNLWHRDSTLVSRVSLHNIPSSWMKQQPTSTHASQHRQPTKSSPPKKAPKSWKNRQGPAFLTTHLSSAKQLLESPANQQPESPQLATRRILKHLESGDLSSSPASLSTHPLALLLVP